MRRDPRDHVADLVHPRLDQLRASRDALFAEGRARIKHSGSEHRPQPLLQRSARKRADNPVDLLPVPNHD